MQCCQKLWNSPRVPLKSLEPRIFMPHMGLNIRIFMDGKFVKSKLSITKKVIVFLDVEFATSTSKLHYIDPRISVACCRRNGIPSMPFSKKKGKKDQMGNQHGRRGFWVLIFLIDLNLENCPCQIIHFPLATPTLEWFFLRVLRVSAVCPNLKVTFGKTNKLHEFFSNVFNPKQQELWLYQYGYPLLKA